MSRVAMVPVRCNNRSESVVLPWSMWAIMLKFLMCDTSIVLRLWLKLHTEASPDRVSPALLVRSDFGSFRFREKILATARKKRPIYTEVAAHEQKDPPQGIKAGQE